MVKVINIMADGKVLDSMDGVVIPVTKRTIPYYEFLYRIRMGKIQEQNKKIS